MRLVKDNVVKIKNDEPSIKRLKGMGYIEEKVEEPKAPEATQASFSLDALSYYELKDLAKERGLEAGNIKKDELKALLEEAEAQ